MKKTFLPVLLAMGILATHAQTKPTASVIPIPASLVENSGSFTLKIMLAFPLLLLTMK